jgi:hypothetical protein
MGIIAEGTIPSTVREGDFAVIDGRRNLGTTTTKTCAEEQ